MTNTNPTEQDPEEIISWPSLEKRFREHKISQAWDLFREAGNLLVEDDDLNLPSDVAADTRPEWRWISALRLWGLDFKKEEQYEVIFRTLQAENVSTFGDGNHIDIDIWVKLRELSIMLCRQFHRGRRDLRPGEWIPDPEPKAIVSTQNPIISDEPDEQATRAEIVKSVMSEPGDFRDKKKVKQLAEKLDRFKIRVPEIRVSSKNRNRMKLEPAATFQEAAARTKSAEYRRLYHHRDGLLVKDLKK
jgi:hypothetical protein